MLTDPSLRPLDLDDLVAEAFADPAFPDRCRRDPGLAPALAAAAEALGRAAFDDADEAAADVAHRVLYRAYDQAMWSPVEAARCNQHDPVLGTVVGVLERAFERSLARVPLPEDPPRDPEAFVAWLRELALERPVVPPSGMPQVLRESATLDQLREIVAQRSLFFLKEPDLWSMVIPSLRGQAKAGLLDLLLDEYGWGRHEHMHSTVYEDLMRRLGLDTTYDAYLDRADHRYLASLTYQGMCARNRRLVRRMYGYIYLVEADSPSSMRTYIAAYRRLGITDEDTLRFYSLHVTADESHSDIALHEVIAPLVRDEPAAAPEIARGVLEGRVLHAAFARHLADSFRAGRSSLRVPA